MGVRLLAASSQYITSPTAVGLSVPFCMGCWIYPFTLGPGKVCISAGDGTLATSYVTITSGTSNWQISFNIAGTTGSAFSNTASFANNWVFLMARWATSSIGWIISYNPQSGQIDQASGNPGGTVAINSLRLGTGVRNTAPTQFYDGIVAEAWWMSGDVVGNLSTTSLKADFVRKLAMQGPFSCPEIADDIVEYKSCMSGMEQAVTDSWSTGLSYSRVGAALSSWTISGGPLVDMPHPPLSPDYVRPGQTPRLAIV